MRILDYQPRVLREPSLQVIPGSKTKSSVQHLAPPLVPATDPAGFQAAAPANLQSTALPQNRVPNAPPPPITPPALNRQSANHEKPQATITKKNPASPNTNLNLKDTGLYLVQQFGPPLLRQFGPPIAKRIGLPIAQRLGPPLARRIGLPLLRRFGLPIAKKAGLFLLNRFIP